MTHVHVHACLLALGQAKYATTCESFFQLIILNYIATRVSVGTSGGDVCWRQKRKPSFGFTRCSVDASTVCICQSMHVTVRL